MKTNLVALFALSVCLSAFAERILIGSIATKEDIAASEQKIVKSAWTHDLAWVPTYSVVADPTSVTQHSITTNETLCTVYSNVVETMTYSLSAKLGVKLLDDYSQEDVGGIAFAPVSGGVVTGTTFYTTAPGLYRVACTVSNDDFTAYLDVPLTARKGSSSTNGYYVADCASATSWRKAVNDLYLSDLKASVWAGTNTANGVWYDRWWTVRCPCRPISGHTVQGYRSRNALTPHVLIAANHYGQNFNDAFPTFRDPIGNTNVSVTCHGINHGYNGYGIQLEEWALKNGWSQAELTAMNISDIAVFPVVSGAVPEACCPKLMTLDKLRARFGGGTLGAWGFAQTYVGTTGPDGIAGGNYMTPHWITISNGEMTDTTTHAADRWANGRSGWNEKDVRADVWNQYVAMRDRDGAGFPPQYGGDSSGGIFIKHGNDWIMLSLYTSIMNGPSICAAVPVLRAYVAQFGDTLKEVE